MLLRTALAPILLLSVLLSACSAPRRTPMPPECVSDATIPGIPHARFWGDRVTPELLDWIRTGLEREREHLRAQGINTWPDTSYLAISGGGADGAYGAGLLCGWTQRGDRPTFRIVTGISTGALIAPFAFAGPDYDHVLREVYTSIATKDIGTSRGVIPGLLSDSLMDSSNLRHLLDKYVDQDFIDHVAAEYRKGRGLIVGTTNMDAQRPVIWALGAIAASGHPGSIELFKDAMMASAAIPGVFPPVMFSVESHGRTFHEMHSDGGVSSQVFLYPASLSIKQVTHDMGVDRNRRVYVIRNAQLQPIYEAVPRRTLPIAQRAISTLIKTQGVGDLYRIYLGCERDDLDFHLAYIPGDFAIKPTEEFDPRYMRALFDLGFQQASDPTNGYPWHAAPPGFEPPEPHPPTPSAEPTH